MSNFLITGGAGNIGSALAGKLASDSNNSVVIVDDLTTGNVGKIPVASNVKFIKCDCNDYHDLLPVFGRHDFDYVYHYAAVVGVTRTLANPLRVLKDIEGIKNILNLSKNTGVKRVFYSSSSEVYGEPHEIPQNETTTPLNSRLPYAVVKNVGESFVRSYFQEYGLRFTIFRFFNTYGPNQSEDFVLPRFLHAALNDEPIYLYGDGLQTRSFCFVEDNVDACIKAMESEDCVNDVINIGSDVEMTILELALQIKQICQSSSEILHLPPLKEGDMKRRCPDIKKMKTILGRDLISLDTGIKKLIESYESRK